jgi:enoyl-CoA hydratase/carnithine racemase
MTDARLLLEVEGPIATITINRPEKLNALDPAMLARFDEIVDQIDRDREIRVAILTAAGEKAFCAGADINAWAALEPIEMWRRWVRDGHRVFNCFAELRQPTIAALNGFAFGGGLELALAADLRVAASHATFASPEVKIATVPGWAGTSRLPQVVGVARAKQMIFGGGRIDADTAERWGLVNEVVAADELMARAWALAEEIAANAPISVQIAKQILNGSSSALEAFAGALAASTADGREGIASFREKRPASFTGN